MERETLNAFDKSYRSFSPSTEIPLDRLNNEPMSLKSRQPDTASYEIFTGNEGANIEAEDTTNREKNSISELLLERREKNPPKIISSFNFELIQFESHGMKHAELIILSTNDKKYCYHYSWQNNRKIFLCYGCKHISIGKSISAKLINNDNGKPWVEMSDVQHECIPVLYKPYIKQEKCVKKENYEIVETITYKGELGSELYIFENGQKIFCRKLAYYSKIKNYICGKCLSKGVRVIALVCKNNVNGEEHIQYGINDHLCLPVSYSLILRKQKAFKPIIPKLNPSSMKQIVPQNVVNNLIENQYHNCQMNNLQFGGINSNQFCCPNNNHQWNCSSNYMATSMPAINNNEYFRTMPSNNYFQYGTTTNYFGNNMLQRNYPPNFNSINYPINFNDSHFVQTQNVMSNQAPIFQPNQEFGIINNEIYNYPIQEISSYMQEDLQRPHQPLSTATTNEMQKEKPSQFQILQNRFAINNAININPTTEISNAREHQVCNNLFSTSKIETAAQVPILQNQAPLNNTINNNQVDEFSNIHDFEIRYQCMPPSNMDKYTLIVFSSEAKNQCYKLYFNKDHGIFICGKCLKRNQPTFVELCQNSNSGKYYLKFGGKPHICKLSNYPPINLAGNERLLESNEYQPMVKKEIHQTSTRDQNISKSTSNKSSELENNSTDFPDQTLSINVPQNKNRIITSQNFKFGPNTIGTPNAKIEVSIEGRLYYYYQQNLGSRYLCTKCSNKKANVTATMQNNVSNGETYFVLNDVEHVCQ